MPTTPGNDSRGQEDPVRVRAMTALAASAGLALSGVLVATGALTPATAVPPVVSSSGVLTERGTGMPATSEPSQQIKSATVTVSPGGDRAQATVVLRATPTAATNAQLNLVLGEYDGSGTCVGAADYATETHAVTEHSGWGRDGATFTLDRSFDLYGGHILADDLDCAFVVVSAVDDVNDFRDLLGGDLTPTYAETKLKITGATLLGSKKIKLLPKEWIKIDVAVKNVGDYETSGLKVSGKGKGVKVKTGKTGTWLQSGSTLTVPVKVKLKNKKKAKVTLTAWAVGTKKVTQKITVKPAKKPKRIKNGKYRTSDKRVTFRVTKGKITSFKATVWALCSYKADHWLTYQMAPMRVPKSGIVQVEEKRYTYRAKFTGRAIGKKVKATLAYMGGGCMANKSFTAQRIG